MVYENWGTWTETDPNNDFTVAANQITISTYDTAADAMVWKDYTASYFENFTHYIDFIIDSTPDNGGIIAIGNYSNNGPNYYDGDNGIWVYLYYSGALEMYLEDLDNNNYGSAVLSLDTRYYCRITRSGTTGTVEIYSDATHETLVDEIEIQVNSTAFRYMGVAGSGYSGGGSAEMSGTLYNLDVGAAAPEGTNLQINIGDAWKAIPAMQINIGDAWKAVAGAQINIGDAWKELF